MYCQHNRTADACELCAYDASVAAGRPMEGFVRDTDVGSRPDAAREADRPPPDKPLPKAQKPR